MSRTAKRSARECSALNESGVLQLVLEYAGAGDHMFLAAVCRRWQQLFDAVHNNAESGTDSSCATFISAAFASVSRVRYAHECGLNLALDPQAQRLVGRCADAAALTAAHALGLELTPNVARGAAQSGSIAKLQVFLKQSCKLPRDITQYAASSGSLELLAWLKQTGHSFTITAMRSAASKGHVHVLAFLRTAGCMWDSSATAAAARGDHLPVLQWLRQRGCPYSVDSACAQAALGGSISVMAALVAETPATVTAQRLTAMLQAAGLAGKLKAAQWLLQQGADWPTVLCYGAQPWPRSTVKWAREQGCTARTAIVLQDSDDSSDHDSSGSDSDSSGSDDDSNGSDSSSSERGRNRGYIHVQQPIYGGW
jgi:hypothetical protein